MNPNGQEPDNVNPIADQNTERLLAGAYRPEMPDPAFVARVTAAMHLAAVEAIEPARPAPVSRSRLIVKRWIGWMAAAGLLLALGAAAGAMFQAYVGTDAAQKGPVGEPVSGRDAYATTKRRRDAYATTRRRRDAYATTRRRRDGCAAAGNRDGGATNDGNRDRYARGRNAPGRPIGGNCRRSAATPRPGRRLGPVSQPRHGRHAHRRAGSRRFAAGKSTSRLRRTRPRHASS